ncbi:hypothetical protein BDR26DRAFT_941985 [Obelidium mucronatum]|nr:hypothetical protein BDR26DRAFT_941985 [Obelidium mucronatum]
MAPCSTFLIISIALLCVATVGFLVLLWFVFYVETYKRGLQISVRTIGTTYNKLLTQMSISLIGIYICALIRLEEMDRIGDIRSLSRCINKLIWNVFVAAFEIGYCLYSFRRTSPVVELVYPQLVVQITPIIKIVPFLFYLQVVPAVVELSLFHVASTSDVQMMNRTLNVLNAITALVTLLLDSILLLTFVRFLNTTRQDETITIDSRFLIISRYGIWIVSMGFLAVAVYIAYAVYGNEEFLMVTLAVVSVIFYGLFAMKVSLFYDDVKRGELNQSRLEKVLGKEQLHNIKQMSMRKMLSTRTERGSSVQTDITEVV